MPGCNSNSGYYCSYCLRRSDVVCMTESKVNTCREIIKLIADGEWGVYSYGGGGVSYLEDGRELEREGGRR